MMLIDNGPKRAAAKLYLLQALLRQFCTYDVGLRIHTYQKRREVFEQFLGLHKKLLLLLAAAAAICQ